MRNLIEKCFVICALMSFSGGLWSLLRKDTSAMMDPTASNPLAFAVAVAIVGLLLIFALRRWRAFVQGAFAAKWVIALSAWAVLSIVWSADPGLTLRRGVALLATTAFGIYLGSNFSRREQIRMLCLTFGIVGLMSLCFSLLTENGLRGEWTGTFSHKNILGRQMDVGFIAFLALGIRRPRVLRFLGLLLCAGLVVMSGSRTAQMVLVAIIIILLPASLLVRKRMSEIVAGVSAACVLGTSVVYFVVTHSSTVLQFLGRDSSLTGRIPLWSLLLEPAQQRLWVGYGFSAFWTGITGPSAGVLLAQRWPVFHAHDGFLELWLNLGLVGVVLFGISLVVVLKHAIGLLRDTEDRESLWPFLFIGWLVFYNLVETSLVRQNDLVWVLYVALATAAYLKSPSTATPMWSDASLQWQALESHQ